MAVNRQNEAATDRSQTAGNGPADTARSHSRQNEDSPAVSFAPELVEPRAWRLKGVGAYGSDVDVISLDQWEELAHLYRTNMAILGAWANAALKRKAALDELIRLHDEGLLNDGPYSEDRWDDARKAAQG